MADATSLVQPVLDIICASQSHHYTAPHHAQGPFNQDHGSHVLLTLKHEVRWADLEAVGGGEGGQLADGVGGQHFVRMTGCEHLFQSRPGAAAPCTHTCLLEAGSRRELLPAASFRPDHW